MLLKSISDERDMYRNERDAANARCNTLTLERDMYYNERDMYRSERDAAYAKIAELERRLAGFQR